MIDFTNVARRHVGHRAIHAVATSDPDGGIAGASP
jgi:hypothetical protein